MLEDRDRKVLFEIERQLLIEDPELARAFGDPSPPIPPHQHGPQHHHGVVTTTIAGLMLCAVLLSGPHRLSDTEIAARTTAGLPRVARKSPGPAAIPVPRRPSPHPTDPRRYL